MDAVAELLVMYEIGPSVLIRLLLPTTLFSTRNTTTSSAQLFMHDWFPRRCGCCPLKHV